MKKQTNKTVKLKKGFFESIIGLLDKGNDYAYEKAKHLIKNSNFSMYLNHIGSLQFIARSIFIMMIFLIQVFIIKFSVDFGLAGVDLVEMFNLPQEAPTFLLVSVLIFFLIAKNQIFLLKELPRLNIHRSVNFIFFNIASFLSYLYLNIYLMNNGSKIVENSFYFLALWYILGFIVGLTLVLIFFDLNTIWNLMMKFKKQILLSFAFSGVFMLSYDRLYNFWPIFSGMVAGVSYFLLKLFFAPISMTFSEGTPTIHLPNFSAAISAPCSGMEGIGLFLFLFSIFVIYNWRLLDKEKILFLYLVGVFGAIVLNILRVTLLFYLGGVWSPQLAMGIFHTNFGWIMYSIYFIVFEYLIYDWVRL